MTIDELMSDEILGRKSQVLWEQRDPRSVAQVARERISRYFTQCPKYNTPSVFVIYQVQPLARGFWDKMLGRDPILEEFVCQTNEGNIRVSSWRGENRKSAVQFDTYLTNAQCVCLTFMFGSQSKGADHHRSKTGGMLASLGSAPLTMLFPTNMFSLEHHQ